MLMKLPPVKKRIIEVGGMATHSSEFDGQLAGDNSVFPILSPT